MKQITLCLIAIFLLSGCNHKQVEYQTTKQKEMNYASLEKDFSIITKDVNKQKEDIEKYLSKDTNLKGQISLKTIDQTSPYINIVYIINSQVQLTFSYHETKNTLVSVSVFCNTENRNILKIIANACIHLNAISLGEEELIQANAFINDLENNKENKKEINHYTFKSMHTNYLQFQILFPS